MILLLQVKMLVKLKLKSLFTSKFEMKDLGKLKYFLGIKMATLKKGLFLNQIKYVMDLLKETEFTDCKPAITPIDS